MLGVPWWLSGLRACHCHCCGIGLTPGLLSQRKKKSLSCDTFRFLWCKFSFVLISSYQLSMKSGGDTYNQLSCAFCIISFFFLLLGLHWQHMEVPRLRVKSELQLLAYPSATATWDPGHICNHSLWPRWIPNPLSEARDCPPVLMVGFLTC